ncbi:hypothetical protein GW17_00032374 [Ensete ventricosum]|nr:hypothetical protein GW17_00032374 [Ensete ventricosum]
MVTPVLCSLTSTATTSSTSMATSGPCSAKPTVSVIFLLLPLRPSLSIYYVAGDPWHPPAQHRPHVVAFPGTPRCSILSYLSRAPSCCPLLPLPIVAFDGPHLSPLTTPSSSSLAYGSQHCCPSSRLVQRC